MSKNPAPAQRAGTVDIYAQICIGENCQFESFARIEVPDHGNYWNSLEAFDSEHGTELVEMMFGYTDLGRGSVSAHIEPCQASMAGPVDWVIRDRFDVRAMLCAIERLAESMDCEDEDEYDESYNRRPAKGDSASGRFAVKKSTTKRSAGTSKAKTAQRRR